MELQQQLDLVFDVDAVLRGQGANASILRSRNPRLVRVAERALQECTPLLQPKVVYEVFPITGVKHERLMLQGNLHIQNRLIAQHMAAASKLIVILATIGDALETHVSRIWDDDMVYALAMDGAGSAAVEALANAACLYFEKQAAEDGQEASIPFSPGMVEWSVADGQPQIFNLLGEAGSMVTLTPSYVMVPRKSLTMVMGIGHNIKSSARTCDFCSMRSTCRYQEQNLSHPI